MLNKKLKIPLYKQLKTQLMKYIEENLKEGDMLPTESELEDMFEVSRATVRGAIEELQSEGLVKKIQGKGTIVTRKKIVQEAGTLTSFTEEMKKKGKTSTTSSLYISEIEPTKRMIDELQLKKNEKVIRIYRVRYADGEPIAILINYLKSSAVPGLLETGLKYESLYEQLEKEYNLHLEKARESVRAEIVTDLEAALLNISPYSAVLKIKRCSFLADGTPIEIVEMTTSSERYEYYIELEGRTKTKLN